MAGVTFSPSILLGQNASAQSDTLKTVNRLKEVVVRGYGAERNLKAPEMGRVSLSSNMIANLPVMFGEPDIVKALQTLPGVSQGMEGFTGLYVRGGDNDQNLFLYQGLPLYHVSHLGGIFSSFNVETVDRVDFYKASFPARYGGRISSITDIAMREPDFNKFGGKVSVGLLSQRLRDRAYHQRPHGIFSRPAPLVDRLAVGTYTCHRKRHHQKEWQKAYTWIQFH